MSEQSLSNIAKLLLKETLSDEEWVKKLEDAPVTPNEKMDALCSEYDDATASFPNNLHEAYTTEPKHLTDEDKELFKTIMTHPKEEYSVGNYSVLLLEYPTHLRQVLHAMGIPAYQVQFKRNDRSYLDMLKGDPIPLAATGADVSRMMFRFLKVISQWTKQYGILFFGSENKKLVKKYNSILPELIKRYKLPIVLTPQTVDMVGMQQDMILMSYGEPKEEVTITEAEVVPVVQGKIEEPVQVVNLDTVQVAPDIQDVPTAEVPQEPQEEPSEETPPVEPKPIDADSEKPTTKLFFVFDVESIGLLGQGYSFGYQLIDSDKVSKEVGGFYVDSSIAKGSDEDRKWVDENCSVSDDMTKVDTIEDLHKKFWEVWEKQKAEGAVLCADCPFPVEMNFIRDSMVTCGKDSIENSPYPFIDIGSVLLGCGIDPLKTQERLENEMPQHNPVKDSIQSARIFLEKLPVNN